MIKAMLRFLVHLRNIETLYRFSPFVKKSFSSFETGTLQSHELREKSGRDIDRYREKKEYKTNFVENLFLGIIDPKVLEYPQIRTLTEVNYIKSHREETNNLMLNYIDCKEIERNGKISADTLELLREKEVLGMKINGLGYFESESSYIQESLSSNISLSKTVAELENVGYEIINLFGNESQKEEYLPRFLNDGCTACLAHLENNSWISLHPLELSTSAVKLPDNNYAVSGQKTLVYNPNSSDIIFVSAKTNGKELGQYTIFMIDKNSEGVTVLEPLNKIGLRGVEICEVVFDEVIVPESNIVGSLNNGSLIVDKLLSRGKLCNGAQCIGMMRKMVNDVIKNSIVKNHFNKPLYKFKYVQGKIGEIVNALYAAESMTYLMTGRVDSCDHINVMLESLIIKVYVSEALNFIVQNYMQFMGREEENDIEFVHGLLRDSYFFSAFDDPNSYLKVLLASVGVKHALSQLQNRTIKEFNPRSSIALRYNEWTGLVKAPKKLRGQVSLAFKDNLYFKTIQACDYLPVRNKLENLEMKNINLMNTVRAKFYRYLHLALEQESIGLEYCVGYLNFWTENLIEKYGSNLLEKTYELMQLGELVTHCVIVLAQKTGCMKQVAAMYNAGQLESAQQNLTFANALADLHHFSRRAGPAVAVRKMNYILNSS